jgi:threonine/homoserine/homoserine lactone efflux protein
VLLAAQAAVLGFSAGASPGPFQALLLERAVRVGPRRALHLALVPLISDPVVIAACLLVLAGLPDGLLRALQLLGGALLCWMGAGALRDLSRAEGGEAGASSPAPGPRRGFWAAALVNLLNPNAWLFWSLVGGPLLAGALRAGPAEAGLFLLAFYLPLVGVNAALVAVFGAVGRLGPTAARVLGGVSALAFLSLGLLQLWRGALGAPW